MRLDETFLNKGSTCWWGSHHKHMLIQNECDSETHFNPNILGREPGLDQSTQVRPRL